MTYNLKRREQLPVQEIACIANGAPQLVYYECQFLDPGAVKQPQYKLNPSLAFSVISYRLQNRFFFFPFRTMQVFHDKLFHDKLGKKRYSLISTTLLLLLQDSVQLIQIDIPKQTNKHLKKSVRVYSWGSKKVRVYLQGQNCLL